MKVWIKFYTESNRDPKIGTLTWEQRGIWAALLVLAGELDHRDEADRETGELAPHEEVAWHLRIGPDQLAMAVAAFQSRDMIDDRDGILFITHYAARQARAPSDAHKPVADRVKRHREAKAESCNETVTPLQAVSNESETRLRVDTEKELEENRRDTEEKRESESPAGDSAGDAPAPLRPSTFAEWQERIRHPRPGGNRNGELMGMITALYPEHERPEFAYVGKAAREVGGAGRLAELLWQHSTRPPSGDVLAYLLAVAKGQKRDGTPVGVAAVDAVIRRMEAMEHGGNGTDDGAALFGSGISDQQGERGDDRRVRYDARRPPGSDIEGSRKPGG